MKLNIFGNSIIIEFNANEAIPLITLPDGYSYERIHLTEVTNFSAINYSNATINSFFCYPPINSKSPCTIYLSRIDPNKLTRIRFLIEKFGQIPNISYFDKAFEPILVKGDDGKEYNVIPSDQFK